MTDVWKSNARKFCELCKVWFADNPVTIQHHQSGQKHKSAVKAKLYEIGNQNKERIKAKSSLQSILAKMESAAMQSMISDAVDSKNQNPCAAIGPAPKPRSYLDPRIHINKIENMASEMALQRKNAYYITTPSEENNSTQTVVPEMEEKVWVEVKMPEGRTYYFHMYTGETTWDTPISFYTTGEYEKLFASLNINEECQNQSATSQNIQEDVQVAPCIENVTHSGEDELGAESTNNVCTQYSSAPEIAQVEWESGSSSNDIRNIPLPSSQVDEKANPHVQFCIKSVQNKSEMINAFENKAENETEESIIEKEYKSAHSEGNITQSKKKHSVQKRQKNDADSPYGAWVPVTSPIKEPKIDLQLPVVPRENKNDLEALKAEDAVEFTERVPVFRKRKENPTPVEFKKRKANLHLRKRDD